VPEGLKFIPSGTFNLGEQTRWNIRKGALIVEGKAAAQIENGTILRGGCGQVYVRNNKLDLYK